MRFSAAQRRQLAKQGKALPDGSFPIRNRRDLRNAVSSVGRTNRPIRARRWIKQRAKDLGYEDLIPEHWW